MLRFGISDRAKLLAPVPQSRLARLLYRFSRSRVSFRLLALQDDPSAEDITLFETLMPYVQLSSGVYRTTYRQRFRKLNPVVNKILAENFKAADRLHIEDWAASDCLTSAEWAEDLAPLFPQVNFVASDLLLFLLEVQKNGANEAFVVEPGGAPLQYIKPPFVLRLSHPEPKLFPVNWFLARLAASAWAGIRGAIKFPLSSSLSDSLEQPSGFQLRKLPLIHPEAIRLAKRDPRFTIRSHSVFERSPEPCQVIRTMNIYNLAYFSKERLREGVRAVLDSLTTGGVWILGRTTVDDVMTHNVTIFRKDVNNALIVIERIGNGSEIEKIALSI